MDRRMHKCSLCNKIFPMDGMDKGLCMICITNGAKDVCDTFQWFAQHVLQSYVTALEHELARHARAREFDYGPWLTKDESGYVPASPLWVAIPHGHETFNQTLKQVIKMRNQGIICRVRRDENQALHLEEYYG